MRVAILSAAPAVRRTLEAILRAAGHQLVSIDDAQYLLADSQHPAPLPPISMPCLTLAAGDAKQDGDLSTPLRPAQLLRRLSQLNAPERLSLGQGWSVDLLARQLTHPTADTVPLTEKECQLLHRLLCSEEAVRREALLADLWGITKDIETHTLETHLYRLRHKLSELNPPAADILTEDGAYRLVSLA